MALYIEWVDPKNIKQCKWAINYLSKIPHVETPDRQVLIDRYGRDHELKLRKIEHMFKSLPRRNRKERGRLMKAAWAQTLLKTDGKVSRQYRLSKEAVKSLDIIARNRNLNLNSTVQELIENGFQEIQFLKNYESEIKKEADRLFAERLEITQKKESKKLEKSEEHRKELECEVTELKCFLNTILMEKYQQYERLQPKPARNKLSAPQKLKVKQKAETRIQKIEAKITKVKKNKKVMIRLRGLVKDNKDNVTTVDPKG